MGAAGGEQLRLCRTLFAGLTHLSIQAARLRCFLPRRVTKRKKQAITFFYGREKSKVQPMNGASPPKRQREPGAGNPHRITHRIAGYKRKKKER